MALPESGGGLQPPSPWLVRLWRYVCKLFLVKLYSEHVRRRVTDEVVTV